MSIRVIAMCALCACTADAALDEDLDGQLEETEQAVTVAPRMVPPEPFAIGPNGERLPLELSGILKPGSRAWAIVLGKALFWDQQAGSDNTACASCHFAAGADLRIRNQLSPGGDATYGSIASDTGEVAPGEMPSGAPARANYTLTPADFPLHALDDDRDRNSHVRTTTDDAIASQGAFDREFVRVGAQGGPDLCKPKGDLFEAAGHPVRRVGSRNTPTTINAAFFYSNLWDGRANHAFNGVGVHGLRDIAGDRDRRLVIWRDGKPKLGHVVIANASLASQAVGPPVGATEMSCDGRTFADVGRKLLATLPLRYQRVDRTDGVLGRYANRFGNGLAPLYNYRWLIEKVFGPEYWAAPGRYKIVDGKLVPHPLGYTQIELNFSLFWGVAIMLYERTLISDQSRFDDWFASCRPLVTNPGGPHSLAVPIANPVVTCRPAPDNPNQSRDPVDHGFTAREVLGFGLFDGGGVDPRSPGSPACSRCHAVTDPVADPFVSPTFSEAAFQRGQSFVPVERSRVDDPGVPQPFAIAGASHDRGFFNLGLRDATTDLGNGGTDPYGNPLSIARVFVREQAGLAGPDPSGIVNRCTTPGLVEPGGTPPYPGCPTLGTPPPLDPAGERFLVDGSFKTPSIRNVGLTPPYFHFGGYSNLRGVVELYARGGNKRDAALATPDATGDWSGSGPLGHGTVEDLERGTNVDFYIRDLRSTDEQIDALVAFLLTTTDPRVQCDRAPFDHPELALPNGDDDNPSPRSRGGERSFTLPAIGRAGYRGSLAKYCIPNAGDLFAPGMGGRRGDD